MSQLEKEEGAEEKPETALAASLARPTLERAVKEQISQLVGDFSGLESISRFLQTVDILDLWNITGIVNFETCKEGGFEPANRRQLSYNKAEFLEIMATVKQLGEM